MRISFRNYLALLAAIVLTTAAMAGAVSMHLYESGSPTWIYSAGLMAFILASGGFGIIFFAGNRKKVAARCLELFKREVPSHDSDLMEGYKALVNGTLKSASDELKKAGAAMDAHVKSIDGEVFSPEAYDNYQAQLLQLRLAVQKAEGHLDEVRKGARMLFSPNQLTHFAV